MLEYRRKNFLTQKQLAELTGLSPHYITALEKEKKKPRASTVAAFEEAVNRENLRAWQLRNCTKAMGKDETELFTEVWKELRKLDPQKEKEILAMFIRILNWF